MEDKQASPVPQKEEQPRTRMNLWMSNSMFSFVQEIASRDGRTMSDVVREAVRDYMAKDKRIMGESVGR